MIKSFLSELAADVDRRFPDASGLCIVFQNQRARVFFKHHLRLLKERTAWMPEIYTIEEFVQRLTPLKILDPTDLLFEFYRVYKETGGTDTFEQFFQWGPILIDDFNDADHYLVSAKKLFSYLTDAKAMELWDPEDGVLTDFQARYLFFWRSFEKWYEAFRNRLIEQRKAYQGLAFRDTAENIKERIDKSPWSKILFAGFNALSNAEEKIIRTLIQSGKAETAWDADRYYTRNESHEAGRFIRKYLKEWHLGNEKNETDFFSDPEKNVRVIGIARAAGQAKVAGDILAELQKETPDMDQTAVVLADESLLFPVLHSIPDAIASVNVSMGLPLRHTPLFDFVEAFFDLHENADRFQRAEDMFNNKFYYKDVVKILRHPFMKFLDPKGLFRSITDPIRKENNLFLSLKELKTGIQALHLPFAVRLFDPWTDIKGAIGFFRELFREMRERILDTEFHKAELEYLNAFSRILNRIESLTDTYSTDMNIKSFRILTREIMSMTRLPFTGEPLQGLQIMGMLETRSIDFENVIMLSVNENILPSAKTTNSLIPFDIRREFGLPTYREKDAIFAYNFYRLLQRAKNIFLLYNTETDIFGKGEVSRFVAQLMVEWPRYNSKIKIHESFFSLPVSDHSLNKDHGTIAIGKDESVLKKLHAVFQSGISPTRLNSYILCPLQFYFRYVAGIRETDEIEESVEAGTLGSVIHKALEDLFTEFVGKTVRPEDVDAMNSRTPSAVRKAYADVYKKGDIDFGKNHLLLHITIKLVRDFLEKQRNLLSKTEILFLEKNLRAELPVGSSKIVLTGKIDRAERTDGDITIIDYKTGGVKDKDLAAASISDAVFDSDLSKSFQLLCYAYLYRKNFDSDKNIHPRIYTFRDLKDGYRTLTVGDKPFSAEMLDAFESELKNLFSVILDPNEKFIQTPKIGNCQYCEFNTLCRREPVKNKF